MVAKKKRAAPRRANPGRTKVTLHNPRPSKRVPSGSIKSTTKILQAACSRAGASDYLFDQKALTDLELKGLIYVAKRVPSGDEEIWNYQATEAGRAAFSRGTVPNPHPSKSRRTRRRYSATKGRPMPKTRRKARRRKSSNPSPKRRRSGRRKMSALQRKYFGKRGAGRTVNPRRRRRRRSSSRRSNPSRSYSRKRRHSRRRRNPSGGGLARFGWKKALFAAAVTIAAAAVVKVAPLAVAGATTTPAALAMSEKIAAGAAIVGGAMLAKKRPAIGGALVVGALVALGLDFVTSKVTSAVAAVKFPGLQAAEDGTAGWNQLGAVGYDDMGAVVGDDMGAVIGDDMGAIYAPGYTN